MIGGNNSFCIGVIGILCCFLFTGCSMLGFKTLYVEYPSPDEKHSILVLHGTTATIMSEWFDETYSISTPEPYRQTKEFYSRSTYEGENPAENKLHDVRWFDIEHIAYGQGKGTRFCSIKKLSSLSECTKLVPKKIKNPVQLTLEDKVIAASQKGQVQEVHKLLNDGADINHRTPYKNTAIIKASEGGHLPVLTLLIKAGADVNAENYFQQTGLSEAIENNHPETVKLLLASKAKVKNSDFVSAVSRGQTETVSYLLAAGANPNAHDSFEPLIFPAILHDNVDIIRMLLDKGVNIEERSKWTGYTPLMEAALWGRERSFQLLLERGADVNAQDSNGKTVLMVAGEGLGRGMATKKSYQKIVNLIIKTKEKIH